jgi:predicted membrane protein
MMAKNACQLIGYSLGIVLAECILYDLQDFEARLVGAKRHVYAKGPV